MGIYSSSQKSVEDTSQFPNTKFVHTTSGLPCSPDLATLIHRTEKTLGHQSAEKSQIIPMFIP